MTLLEKHIDIHKPGKLPLKTKLINSLSCLESNCAFCSFILELCGTLEALLPAAE